MSKFIDELSRRGLIQNSTATIEELRDHFGNDETPVKFYIGFDPTASSLHVGSLQQLVIMDLAKKFGHEPILLMGGATASIGDPSFRDDMRPMMSKDAISDNISKISSQCESILGTTTLVNNISWTKDINFLDFLRDFGSHFSVNRMLSFSSVKDRMEREGFGLSVLEFSYSMLQALDFLHLNRNLGVTVQMGGSDQWANILQGVELVHKIDKKKVIGITNPLVLKSDGTKMGKTAGGAVWLDKEKTSVFDFFQFWRNLDDSEATMIALRFLGIDDEVNQDDLTFSQNINMLKNNIGLKMVEFVHGVDEREKLEKELKQGTASKKVSVNIGDADNVFDMLLKIGIFSSKGEIRRMIKHNENIMINDNKITSEDELSTKISIGDVFDVRKGKKHRVTANIV